MRARDTRRRGFFGSRSRGKWNRQVEDWRRYRRESIPIMPINNDALREKLSYIAPITIAGAFARNWRDEEVTK